MRNEFSILRYGLEDIDLSITLWPRVQEIGPRSEPVSFVDDIIAFVEKDLGRGPLLTWIVNDSPTDLIIDEDCKAIASCLRRRAEALGGISVRGEIGINDPESLIEFADFLERSGGILITP